MLSDCKWKVCYCSRMLSGTSSNNPTSTCCEKLKYLGSIRHYGRMYCVIPPPSMISSQTLMPNHYWNPWKCVTREFFSSQMWLFQLLKTAFLVKCISMVKIMCCGNSGTFTKLCRNDIQKFTCGHKQPEPLRVPFGDGKGIVAVHAENARHCYNSHSWHVQWLEYISTGYLQFDKVPPLWSRECSSNVEHHSWPCWLWKYVSCRHCSNLVEMVWLNHAMRKTLLIQLLSNSTIMLNFAIN